MNKQSKNEGNVNKKYSVYKINTNRRDTDRKKYYDDKYS